MNILIISSYSGPETSVGVLRVNAFANHWSRQGHDVHVLHPGQFATRPCPGSAGIDLAVRPYKLLAHKLDALHPDAVHLADRSQVHV